MTTLGLFWWLLALSGVVQVVTQGGIFQGVREGIARRSRFLGELVVCPLCFGVWLGGGMTLLGFGSPTLSLILFPSWTGTGIPWQILARLVAAVLDGAALSLVAYGWTVARAALARPAALRIDAPPTSSPAATEAVYPWERPARVLASSLPPCPVCDPDPEQVALSNSFRSCTHSA